MDKGEYAIPFHPLTGPAAGFGCNFIRRESVRPAEAPRIRTNNIFSRVRVVSGRWYLVSQSSTKLSNQIILSI